ncbi:MAG: lactoylglutathione lyase [Cytophagaceae bacterium]|nr:lactoylglutathione lyase [Cytophagaceae bacterium]|tara:strand:+ start:792 stop:1184 length:393 start_codon:yes stop_codon:yes gene_type:complete
MENKRPNPVVWFEIYVNDMSRAQRFYETVLDIQLDDLPTPPGEDGLIMKFFPNEISNFGSGGALCKMPGFVAGGNGTLVYFGSADCSVEEARIAAAGGKVFKSKFSIGDYGFVALATDTEGNMFGLHSMH